MIEFYIGDIKTTLTDVDDITDTANRQHGEIDSLFCALHTKIERALKKLEKDMSAAKAEKTMANDTIEHNREVEARIKAEITRIEGEIDRLEEENRRNEQEIEKLNRKIDAIKEASGESSGGRIASLESTRDGLERDIRENNKKIEKYKKKLEELKKKLAAVKRAIAQLKDIASQISAALSALRAAYSAVKQALGALRVAGNNYEMEFAHARGGLDLAREHTLNALNEAQELIACFGRMKLDTFSGHFAISSPDILSHLSMDIAHSAVMVRGSCSDVRYDMGNFGRSLRDNITVQTGEFVHRATDSCEDLCFEWDNYSLELKNAYYRAKNYLDQRIT